MEKWKDYLSEAGLVLLGIIPVTLLCLYLWASRPKDFIKDFVRDVKTFGVYWLVRVSCYQAGLTVYDLFSTRR